MVGLNLGPLLLRIHTDEFEFDSAYRGRILLYEFLQRHVVFLQLLVVAIRVRRLVGVGISRLGNSSGHAAAVGMLVGQKKFRHMNDVVGRDQAVQIGQGQIKNLVRFQPLLQFRGHL